MGAKLYFRYGVMGSAKSAELLLKAHQLQTRDLNVYLMKPSIDTRENAEIIKSRAGLEAKCICFKPDENLIDIIEHININKHIDFILIDESQFLTPKQVDQLAWLVDHQSINIICYGLRTDYTSHLFKGSKRLFELADTIEEIKSTCSCGRKAIINARIINGKIIKTGKQIDIGGDDKYISLCRHCWNEDRKCFIMDGC